MREPHLLRFAGPVEELAPLLAAAREAGHRVGWLEVRGSEPESPDLDPALGAGADRAVAVGPRRTVRLEARRGPALRRDLLRRHFPGARLVIVRAVPGEPAAEEWSDVPSLERDGDRWRVAAPGGEIRRRTTGELAAALRRHRLVPDSG